jgi:phage N-6-adenine-methyltransferase
MTHERNDKNKTPKDSQRTPPELFRKLDDRFQFNMDAAASNLNHLCDFYYTGSSQYDDGLIQPWNGVLGHNTRTHSFCNCPYSKPYIGPFVQKGYLESLKGALVVMLIPADLSTAWWDYCMYAAEWIRIKGRVVFNEYDGTPCQGSPKFASVAVVFDAEQREEQDGKLKVTQMKWRK